MGPKKYVTCCHTLAYNCDLCKISCKSINDFIIHLKEIHVIFACTCCSYSTKIYGSLRQHNQDKHRKYYSLLHCPFCHFLADYWKTIEDHIIFGHIWLDTGYYCSNCGYYTKDTYDIENHVRFSHNAMLKFCFCSVEPELFKHFRNYQTIPPYFHRCSFCNYQNKGFRSLAHHFKDTHFIVYDDDDDVEEEEVVPTCMVCYEEVNGSLKEMKDHLISHNTSITCKFCADYL